MLTYIDQCLWFYGERSSTGPGMPAMLYLQEFGSLVWDAFGSPPYLVGSCQRGKTWRDVDVRLILDDELYEAMGFGEPDSGPTNAKWVAMVLAFSALGRHMTGLPIDFQIQQQTRANRLYRGTRNALGLVPLRYQQFARKSDPPPAPSLAGLDDDLRTLLEGVAQDLSHCQFPHLQGSSPVLAARREQILALLERRSAGALGKAP